MPPLEPSRPGGDDRDDAAPSSSDPRQRWSAVKALFLEALEHPASERRAFVARTAVDAEVADEVEELLSSEEAAGSLAETPAAALLGTTASGEEEAARLPPGARLGSYEILEFIAAGGMGAVYRARHVILGREVAIKTVSRGLPDETARRRLVREARHASTLNHPNICRIHDVGEADGLPFIVMEYVNGRTLKEMLRAGPLELGRTLDLAIQVAGALAHAHGNGIIHRDLKSANVVVDAAGRAIVLDFGLARRLPNGTDLQTREPTVTMPDTLAGTLSHMAPELLRGDAADERSDIWSLGVLLYELATAELPFVGRTPFETSSAILGDPPRPVSARVPLALRLIIERCLEKSPGRRYQQARDVQEAIAAIRRRHAWPVIGRLAVAAHRRTLLAFGAVVLVAAATPLWVGRLRQAIGGVIAGHPAPTVAILPLESDASDSSGAYYADGITDALVSQLGASTDMRVLSRASTARVLAATSNLRDVGARLAADVVVRGTLHRSATRVAIDLSAIRPSSGQVLWSDRYERESRDVLALEADVVRALATALQGTLRPEARERLAAIRAVSPEVYEAYLEGRYEWNKRTPGSIQAAITHFARAVALDPTYAPAHAALADCYNQLGTVMLGGGSPREMRPRAAAEAIQALQLDPYSAEAHAALGYVRHYQWRWGEAERELRRAIALNPSYSMARIWYANLLMSHLRFPEAIAQVNAARELDPYSLIVNTNVGWVLLHAGHADEAAAQLRQTLALDSTYPQARWRLADALATAGHYPEALREGRRLAALGDSAASVLGLLADIQARAGNIDSARALLERVRARARHEYVPPGTIAGIYASLGETDSTMAWLQRAFDEQSNLIAYLGSDPSFIRMRTEPRFQALLARAGLR